MRNLFVKNYTAFAALILISFTFAGCVFMAQISRYSVKEKKGMLETTVDYVDAMVEKSSSITDGANTLFLDTYLGQQAAASGCTILITDSEGNVLMSSTPQSDGMEEDEIQGSVSDVLVDEINQFGSYFGMGNISGLFSENYFIAGTSSTDGSGETVALVIAAIPSATTTDMMRTIMQSYLFIVIITLVFTLIISWFVSDRLTRPLKSIVSAAKRFEHGDFNVRVSENNNCDEIDELAVSFNNMATTLPQQEELSCGCVANVSH